MTKLTGGFMNGKKFITNEADVRGKKLTKNLLKDFDYETLFAKTAHTMNLQLEDKSPKQKEVLKLLDELKQCEEHLLNNLDKIKIEYEEDGTESENSKENVREANSALVDLSSRRITLDKLKNDSMNTELAVKHASSSMLGSSQNAAIRLVDSIVKASGPDSLTEPGTPIRRIEDISPFEFRQDLLRTTDWHLYYTKLSALSLFVREKTYWPYFTQVFMVSARMNDGIQDLKRYLLSRARPGNWVFNRSMMTDQMPQDIAEMCVREKLLENLPGEVPYLLHIETSFWEVDDNDCLNIVINVLPGPKSWNFKRHLVNLEQIIFEYINCSGTRVKLP